MTVSVSGMGARVVKPEILDYLPTHDREAQRSRRDLRRINFLMGNQRWICRTIEKFPDPASRGIVELGAGDGILAGKLARAFPNSQVTACDLAPRPTGLDGRVIWRQGDVLSDEAPLNGGILVANFFLHHFEEDTMEHLGRLCAGFEVVVFNEPNRAMLPHMLGTLIWPMINRVTRHDLHVSIFAGFVAGEMTEQLGLQADIWRFRETSTWRGSRRVLGWRA